jgi:hypothetical protein
LARTINYFCARQNDIIHFLFSPRILLEISWVKCNAC